MKEYKPKISNSSISLRYALMSMCMSAVCCSVILHHLEDKISYDRMSVLIILFNVLSVGLMSVISVFADKVNNKHTGVRLSVFLAILGFYLPAEFGIDLKVVLLGIGSASFGAFASSSLLSRSKGKSLGMGLYLGGQALGIACASFAGFAGFAFAPLLMILAVPSDRYSPECVPDTEPKPQRPAPSSLVLPFILLFFSYMLLSYELSSVSFSWDVWAKSHFLLLASTALGPLIGGIVSDLIGRTVTVSLGACGGTLLVYFCSDSKWLSLLGLLLLSSALAPTVTAAYRIMPKLPAFSFAVMSLSAYLGQVLSSLFGFKPISMLFICAAMIVFAFASELQLTPTQNTLAEEDENEDI